MKKSFASVALVCAMVFSGLGCDKKDQPQGQQNTAAKKDDPKANASVKASTTASGATTTASAKASGTASGAASTVASAAGSAKATDDKDGGSITFTKKFPKVGDKQLHEDEMKMTLTIEPAGGKGKAQTVEMHKKVKYAEEVLAFDEKTQHLTKVKVTFEEFDEKDPGHSDDKDAVSPKGHSYTVERGADGKLHVLDDKGKEVANKKEAKKVKKEFKELGKDEQFAMLKALPDKPIKVGDDVPALVEALKKQFNKDKGGDDDKDGGKEHDSDVESLTVKLKEIKDEGGVKVGIFEMTAVLKDKKSGMEMKLAGTVAVRSDNGWPTMMKASGPITMKSKEADGKGEVSMSKISKYN